VKTRILILPMFQERGVTTGSNYLSTGIIGEKGGPRKRERRKANLEK